MRIIGIDEVNSSHEEGNAERWLTLDEYPSPEWCDCFGAAHKNYFSTSKRQTWVNGRTIVVTCTLDEVQSQIEFLNKICSQATHEWEHLLAREKQAKEDREQEALDKKTKAEDIYRNLKF